MPSNWVTNGFWWLLTLMLYLLLNLDISSLTIGILRSRCILRILKFSIGIVEELLCWNYSLFPIVESHRSKQVLIRLYIRRRYDVS